MDKLLNKRGMIMGVHARIRASGMASLLTEVLASNAARDLDEDLKDRIRRAIGDQNDVTAEVRYSEGTNTGHGHVWERPDGVKARCGGPHLCKECMKDAASIDTSGGT